MKLVISTKKKNIIGILAAAVLLSACGGSSHRDREYPGEDEWPGSTTGGSTGGSIGGSTGGSTGGTTGGSTGGSTGGDPTLPVETYSFSMTGQGGTQPSFQTPEILTDTTLKVRVIPGAASNLSLPGQYSNFSAVYGCISYSVTLKINGISNQTIRTQSLKVPGTNSQVCPNSQESQVLDFSGRMTPGTSGLTIAVSAPMYDYYCTHCQMSWWYYGYSYMNPYVADPACSSQCTMKTVYRNHTVTGSLEIQTNGASF